MPSLKSHFPFFTWFARKATGRWARQTYACIILVALCLTTAARIRSYLLVRKVQAALQGLAEVRVDQTTEEQLLRILPHLTRRDDWKAERTEHIYYEDISNESDFIRLWSLPTPLIEPAASVVFGLGYRCLNFYARVIVQDARVSQVTYDLSKECIRGAVSIVSVRTDHGFWRFHQYPFTVTSREDASPQYRIYEDQFPSSGGYNERLAVIFTNDAPPEKTTRAFQLNLSCFWGLRACQHARQIAPALSEDAKVIEESTYKQLISDKCPDSIIEGRVRYLPDVSVLLLEVTRSRRIEVNEEGDKAEDWFTDYRFKEVIRGYSWGYDRRSLKDVRFRRTIPSPADPTLSIANPIWPETKTGALVLFFPYPRFYSCRFLPATPSALAIVRNAPIPLKRPEDEAPARMR